MGCYQEGIPKDTVGGKDVTAHIFEYAHLELSDPCDELTEGPVDSHPKLLSLRLVKSRRVLAQSKFYSV